MTRYYGRASLPGPPGKGGATVRVGSGIFLWLDYMANEAVLQGDTQEDWDAFSKLPTDNQYVRRACFFASQAGLPMEPWYRELQEKLRIQ